MGCAKSKIENEEMVSRCKNRKIFMKEAVSARNAFAAAHFAYAMSLKNTGAALSGYAHGEVHEASISSSSTTTTDAVANANANATPAPVPPPNYVTLPPPPPPISNLPSVRIQRAVSLPEFAIPKPDVKHSDTIIEDEDEDEEIESESVHSLRRVSSKRSGGGDSRGAIPRRDVEDDEQLPRPPSPPPPITPPQSDRASPPPPPPDSSWDFFYLSMDSMPGPNLVEADENRMKGDEIEGKMFRERSKRNEAGVGDGNGGGVGKMKTEIEEKAGDLQLQPQPVNLAKAGKKVKQAIPTEGRRKGSSSLNLLQVFTELDDCFLRASESAHEVSKMLEANRLHYHSNFADNRGHIDHSARVMRVITWNKSFRGFSKGNEGNEDFDSEENETHATVLDKMLAWEKKLYEEAKVGEQVKFGYHKQVAALNKLKKRSKNADALERMKAAVSHMHTRYIVDMQSMDSTVSEINRLRDKQLYPKLVAVVDGMATMWEAMRVQHAKQFGILQALRSVDISESPMETADHHYERTVQLWDVVQEWHSQFDKLMTHQKGYIKALNNWLKLNLIPIDNNWKEKVSSPQRPTSPFIQALLVTWQDFLEKLPDGAASTAIGNFAAVIQTIVQYQEEEIKLRNKCEDTRRELDRKKRQFVDWHNKYLQRRTPPDEMDPANSHDKDPVADRKLAVDLLSSRLQDEEAAYKKQCVQVRKKSLMTLKSRLPELFSAMTAFSHACSVMYRNLRSISQHVNPEVSSQ